MFKYIRAMSIEKKKVLDRFYTNSDTLVEHIVKVVLYSSSRADDVNGWKKTCARILTKAGSYNRKRLKISDKEYVHNLFGSFPTDPSDARAVLEDFEGDLVNKGYPETEYDLIYRLGGTLYVVCSYVMKKSLAAYSTNNQDLGYEYYRTIVDKAFEQVGL